jgi:hypothetical protein
MLRDFAVKFPGLRFARMQEIAASHQGPIAGWSSAMEVRGVRNLTLAVALVATRAS